MLNILLIQPSITYYVEYFIILKALNLTNQSIYLEKNEKLLFKTY